MNKFQKAVLSFIGLDPRMYGNPPLPEGKLTMFTMVDEKEFNRTQPGEIFAITRERADELSDYMRTAAKKNSHPVSLMVEVSKICRHPNELGLTCFRLGEINEKDSDPLARFLSSLLKNPPKDDQ